MSERDWFPALWADYHRRRKATVEARRSSHYEPATEVDLVALEDAIAAAFPVRASGEDPERTLASLATMLGWGNVPPRETLEATLRALRARLERVAAYEWLHRSSPGEREAAAFYADLDSYRRQCDALRAENARLREAIEADARDRCPACQGGHVPTRQPNGDWWHGPSIFYRCGAYELRARAALAEPAACPTAAEKETRNGEG